MIERTKTNVRQRIKGIGHDEQLEATGAFEAEAPFFGGRELGLIGFENSWHRRC